MNPDRVAYRPRDRRVVAARATSVLVLIALACGWHIRTTGHVVPGALALVAVLILAITLLGRLVIVSIQRLCPAAVGLVFEFLFGFFLFNSALFAAALLSPLSIGWHAAILIVCIFAGALFRSEGRAVPLYSLRVELATLVTIVVTGALATLWVVDQQPIGAIVGDRVVFSAWYDIFIHAREISAFAQSSGYGTLHDIKLSGVQAPVYHFASYMLPALLVNASATSALEAYAAFMLPIGLLLVGLAAYSFVAISLRTTWPAVVAAVVVLSFPDAYQQGFGIRYLSFAFMSQVNLGMLYGIACMSLSWIFMIEACDNRRVAGLLLAFVFLSLCATYKAHLFVANALILMLYPCVFFGDFQRRWRVLTALCVLAVFVVVINASQQLQRVPTLRLDGSGLSTYVEILMSGFANGYWRRSFVEIYFGHHWPHWTNAGLAGTLILLASFGIWTVVTPIALWGARHRMTARVTVFVAIVFVNYMAMSMFLALDERGVGSREEFLNRPQAWAYFVVVVFTAAAIAIRFERRETNKVRRNLVFAFSSLVVAALTSVRLLGPNIQTLPEWSGFAEYAEFNAQPVCLERAATHIRHHSTKLEVVLDSGFDPKLITSAISERQTYVADAAFGGHLDIVEERLAVAKALLLAHDERALREWAGKQGVAWLLLRPDDAQTWSRQFLGQAVFQCDGYRVLRL